MIIVYAFLLSALLAVWGAAAFDRANRKVDRLIEEAAPGYGKGCRCDWLGRGTPEHDASPLCISLRPDADRDLS